MATKRKAHHKAAFMRPVRRPANPRPAYKKRRHPRRNPPLVDGALVKEAIAGLSGFIVTKYAGKVLKAASGSMPFLQTPAGSALVEGAVAIGAGMLAGRMVPGTRGAVTVGGITAASVGFMARAGVPGLSGLGASAVNLSDQDMAEIASTARMLRQKEPARTALMEGVGDYTYNYGEVDYE